MHTNGEQDTFGDVNYACNKNTTIHWTSERSVSPCGICTTRLKHFPALSLRQSGGSQESLLSVKHTACLYICIRTLTHLLPPLRECVHGQMRNEHEWHKEEGNAEVWGEADKEGEFSGRKKCLAEVTEVTQRTFGWEERGMTKSEWMRLPESFVMDFLTIFNFTCWF